MAMTSVDISTHDSLSASHFGVGSSSASKQSEMAGSFHGLEELCVTEVRVKQDAVQQPVDRQTAVRTHIVAAAREAGVANALMAIDVAQVQRQAAKWAQTFPHVAPFYAVKSLPDRAVVATLAAEQGVGFDCASRAEIDLVMAAGAEPERVIFANPCKFPRDIAHAKAHGIRKMTFDNDDELEKVASIFPNAQLVLRIVTDDSASVCRLSNKYGAAIEDCEFLLQRSQELGLDVIGVSFHVGSGASNARAFVDALTNARKVFDTASQLGMELRFLDIGGGFPGDDTGDITLADIAAEVTPVIAELFADEVQVISEPGRFFSHSATTLATQVIGRRVLRRKAPGDPDVLYYVGDGVYGSFNCMLYDHYTPALPVPVSSDGKDLKGAALVCKVFGPTCDGIDMLYEDAALPLLEVGDWLVFSNMGAYTICAASNFNGLEKPHVSYIRT